MSDLSSVFNKLANAGTTNSSTPSGWGLGNNSWAKGTPSSNKPYSYVMVSKAPKVTSSSVAKSVAAKLGTTIPKAGAKPTKKGKHHSSLLGDILGGAADVASNLGADVINTAENMPSGILKLATTNPIDSAKAIAHDYATRYGKLFHGDIGGFASDVAAHPFGYLLDASTLGTGGGAVLGRLAPALAKGGEVSLRIDRAASKAGTVENTTRQLSTNPFTRNVFEKPAYALQRTLPGSVPVVGEKATAIRHITGQVEAKVGALGHAQQVFSKTVRDIRHSARKDDTLTQAIDQVSHDLRTAPHKVFGQETPGFTPRKFDPKFDTNISEAASKYSPAINAVADAIKTEIKPGANGTVVAKDGASAATHSFVKFHNSNVTLGQSLSKVTEASVAVAKPENFAKQTVAKAKKTVKADVHKPINEKPTEHTLFQRPGKKIPNPHYGKMDWSQKPPRMQPQYIEDTPINVTNTPIVAKAAKHETPTFDTARAHGPINQGPKSASRVANKVAPKSASYLDGVKRVDTHTDPISNYLEMHGKAVKTAGNAISKGFTEKFGTNPSLTREITNIFDKHSPAGSLQGSFNKATQVWKDVILVGRPAFLVNNYIGNQTMYHLKQGLGGLSLQKAVKGELDPAFDNHFFEHRQSLGSSEKAAPKYDNHGNELAPSRYRRNADRIYNLQSKHEQVLRKATMREAAMSIPAIKTEVRRLVGEGKANGAVMSEGEALSKAMTKAFKDNPGYREVIGKAIDDTMGNYRHYNNFEKGLKAIVPFYGWNRHALRTYSSLIKDQPGRTSALADVSRQGQAEHDKMFPGTPSFMQGYVKGKLGVFDTQALNPLKGGSDTVRSLKELVSGNAGNMPAIASNLNPLLSGATQALTGVNATTGAKVTEGHGLLGSVGLQIGNQLPQVKITELALKQAGITGSGANRKDPHYFLTPTGQLKRKFKDSEGKVKFGPDGLPMEAADRHMINQSLENNVLAFLGAARKDINLKTAQTVQKSILSKTQPNNEFHARKSTVKAKIPKSSFVTVDSLGKKKKHTKTGFAMVGG